MALYLLKLRHLIDYYINLLKDFYDLIDFSHIYFNYKKLKPQSDIIELIVYYKIIKTE